MSHSRKFRAETEFPGIIVYKTVFSNTIPDAAEATSVRQNQTGEDIFMTQTKYTNNSIHPTSIVYYKCFCSCLISKPKTNELRYEFQI